MSSYIPLFHMDVIAYASPIPAAGLTELCWQKNPPVAVVNRLFLATVYFPFLSCKPATKPPECKSGIDVSHCDVINDAPVFKDCRKLIPETFKDAYDNCVYDKCLTGVEAQCGHMEALVEECNEETGGEPLNWRASVKCREYKQWPNIGPWSTPDSTNCRIDIDQTSIRNFCD